MPPTNSASKLKFFRYLPSEIFIDILSRLPIRTIVICKCVCRSWRDLLCSREFAEFHLSKSAPGVVTSEYDTQLVRIYEFHDELGLEHHHLHQKPITKIEHMELIGSSWIEGSANGLLLLHKSVTEKCDALYICNPITRECIELLHDRLVHSPTLHSSNVIFTRGFGVSRMTSQYKVVRILHDRTSRGRGAHTLLNVTMSICLVYTLGTGIWRCISPPVPFLYDSIAVYLNGNLHWLVQGSDGSFCISCFDLETEIFSTFTLPSPLSKRFSASLVVLGDSLCVSYTTTEDDVVIWLMKEYGDEKSWTKEFVIKKIPIFVLDEFFERDRVVYPIKVSKDGDILMALHSMYVIYISKTSEHAQVFREYPDYVNCMEARLHTSSFFSLSSFVNERVIRF